jgi:Holliday junction DNA helicase RuvA
LIIEVQGIGYELFVPLSTFYRLPEVKESVALSVYTHVREDALQLYGFFSTLEKQLFLLLLGVSGVGPKLALNILSGMETSEMVQAICQGNVDRLRAIPGVGPKTAGRVILELKEKVSRLAGPGSQFDTPEAGGENKIAEDTLSALINLGYNRIEAKRAIDQIVKDEGAASVGLSSVEEFIKKALKGLAKG